MKRKSIKNRLVSAILCLMMILTQVLFIIPDKAEAAEGRTVADVIVFGIIKPVVGELAGDTLKDIYPIGYTAANSWVSSVGIKWARWYDISAGDYLNPTDAFEEGKQYSLSIFYTLDNENDSFDNTKVYYKYDDGDSLGIENCYVARDTDQQMGLYSDSYSIKAITDENEPTLDTFISKQIFDKPASEFNRLYCSFIQTAVTQPVYHWRNDEKQTWYITLKEEDGTLRLLNDVSSPTISYNQDITNLLFASAATNSSSTADFEDAMTLRFDGDEEIYANATVLDETITVFNRNASFLYLYVQGSNNGKEWVYSKRISGSKVLNPKVDVSVSDILADSRLTEKNINYIDLSKCRIWLEVTESNVAYAKYVKNDVAFDYDSYEQKTLNTMCRVPECLALTDITYTSSDEDIATVDSFGNVMAHRYGNVTITATIENGKTSSYDLQTRFYDVAGSNIKENDDYQYFYDPVYWAAENGITTGYNRVFFGPERQCTRQELLIFLWRIAGQPSPKGDARKYFSDVTAGTTTATNKSIAWAYENGITKGYSEGGKQLFKPTNPVTRQETMIFLWRVAGQPEAKGTLTFDDCKNLDKKSATYKSILWGSKNGITGGYPDGTFGLTKDCLREAIVTFLYRFSAK